MSSTVEQFLEAAFQAGRREELCANIEATNLGEHWEVEIKRRIDDVDSGRVKTVPAEEVFARLEQRFRECYADCRLPEGRNARSQD